LKVYKLFIHIYCTEVCKITMVSKLVFSDPNLECRCVRSTEIISGNTIHKFVSSKDLESLYGLEIDDLEVCPFSGLTESEKAWLRTRMAR